MDRYVLIFIDTTTQGCYIYRLYLHVCLVALVQVCVYIYFVGISVLAVE